MSPLARIGARGTLAVAGSAALVSGLVFALQGDTASPPSRPNEVVVASPTTSASAAAPSSEATTASTAVVPSPTGESVSPPVAPAVATAAPRPMTQAVAPAPTPTSAAPISDLPKYTDVAVLALAADARLPSGRTFRECVELPPSHEKWPTPVHLYYEGKGKWLVETHVSEVQVVFDEATATFSTRNFAPTSPDCAKPR